MPVSKQKRIILFCRTINNGSSEGFQKVCTSPKCKVPVFIDDSVGYRVAFVSPIYKYDNFSPTIVEFLTYWIASSARLPGTHKLPKVISLAMYRC